MKTRTKNAVKRLLGGAISVALSLAMALCIFAGTGIEVKAAETWSIEAYTLPYDFSEVEQSCVTIEESEWDEEVLTIVTEFLKDNPKGLVILKINGKTDPDNVTAVRIQDSEVLNTSSSFQKLEVAALQGYSYYILKKNTVSTTPGSTSQKSGSKHTHSYAWETVQEVTAEQDGVEEYRCSCGDVQARCVLPRYMAIVKGLYGAVKDAPQNGTAVYDTGSAFTMTDYVIRKLAERSDVTTVVTFEYQGQAYRMTIPAGADYTGLLADEEYFYGYFYFADVVGATIEAL